MGGSSSASDDPSARFQNAVTIEASLAFKEVKPKNKQPQKQKKQTYRPPEEQKIDTDNVQQPEEPVEKPKHKVKVKPEEIDISKTLAKNRAQDEDLSSTGVDEVPRRARRPARSGAPRPTPRATRTSASSRAASTASGRSPRSRPAPGRCRAACG